MSVKSLQRKLLLVSGGISVVVGVSGFFIWRNMKRVTEELSLRTTVDPPSSDQSDRVVIKRVLVRRREDASPDDLGEVLEEHVLGSFQEGSQFKPSMTAPRKKSFDAKEAAKQLSFEQKVGVFGTLVALFVGFNLWAIPKLRRGLGASSSSACFPKPMMDLVKGRSVFVDLACGDGQRTLEAKQFFEMVHGFDCSTTPIRDASECLGKADLVYCDTKALAKEAWPLVRNGAFMYTSEELADVPILWKGQEKQLYKKD